MTEELPCIYRIGTVLAACNTVDEAKGYISNMELTIDQVKIVPIDNGFSVKVRKDMIWPPNRSSKSE